MSYAFKKYFFKASEVRHKQIELEHDFLSSLPMHMQPRDEAYALSQASLSSHTNRQWLTKIFLVDLGN